MKTLIITLVSVVFACTACAGTKSVVEMTHPSTPYLTNIIEVEEIDATHGLIRVIAPNCAIQWNGKKYKNVKLKRIPSHDPNQPFERYIYDTTEATEIDSQGNDKRVGGW